jgi:effector-binding domain-containing protein
MGDEGETKMWRIIGLGVVALLVALIGAGFVLPTKTHVERAITINAPQDQVFRTLNNIKEFNSWSPWLKIDPAATITFSGPESGEGAAIHWTGRRVGKGALTVVAVTPESHIDYALEFDGKAGSKSWLDLKPKSSGIEVTWGFESAPYGYNILSRYAGALIFGPLTKRNYKSGLADLKTYVESKAALPSAPAASSSAQPPSEPALPPGVSGEILGVEAKTLVVLAGETMGAQNIGDSLNAAYAKIAAYLSAHGLTAAGAPVAISHSWEEKTQHWVFDAGIPVAAAPAKAPTAEEGVKIVQSYAGKAAKFHYHGSPADSSAIYAAIFPWLKSRSLAPAGDSWEEYLTDPKTPMESWDVNIYFPVK